MLLGRSFDIDLAKRGMEREGHHLADVPATNFEGDESLTPLSLAD